MNRLRQNKNRRRRDGSTRLNSGGSVRRNRFRQRGGSRRWQPGAVLQGLGVGLLLAALSVGFVFVHDLVTQSRSLVTRRVEVIGNRRLDPAAVMRQAGVHPGDNILAVRLGQTRRQLLGHAWIAQAAVRRRLPDTIEIRIGEHTPFAMLRTPGGRLLVNTAGIPFKRWQPGDPERLPVIEGLGYAALATDSRSARKAYAASLEALRQVQQTGDMAQLLGPLTVHTDRDTGVILKSSGPVENTVLGYRAYPQKLDNLKRLLRHLDGRPGWTPCRRVDLTNLHRIVLRPSRAMASTDGQKEALHVSG